MDPDLECHRKQHTLDYIEVLGVNSSQELTGWNTFIN